MKTILITGINGFLGSRLASRLKVNYNVVGVVRNIDSLHRLKGHEFKVYSSENDLEKIFQENNIYAIIHAATVYRRNDDPIEKLIYTNILLPVELYKLANKYSTTIFLNTDTFFNNPEFDYKYLMDYTLSKKQVLEWLKIMQDKCQLINMKIFHMYGKNDSPGKFFPKLLSDIKNNQPVIDLTPGEQRRDFIYIEDVVSAYEAVLQQVETLEHDYIEFQIGTGVSTSIKQLASVMAEVTNSTTKLNFGALAYRENEIMDSVSDNRSLIEIGWRVDHDLRKGIEKLIN